MMNVKCSYRIEITYKLGVEFDFIAVQDDSMIHRKLKNIQ
jgi:hypothetical protein